VAQYEDRRNAGYGSSGNEGGRNLPEAFQPLSGYLLVPFDPLTGDIDILAGEALSVSIGQDANVEIYA
jgi:hypothetical protein